MIDVLQFVGVMVGLLAFFFIVLRAFDWLYFGRIPLDQRRTDDELRNLDRD